jgi:hypothetical protein
MRPSQKSIADIATEIFTLRDHGFQLTIPAVQTLARFTRQTDAYEHFEARGDVINKHADSTTNKLKPVN